MIRLKVSRIGGSFGVVLPGEVLETLRISDGDELVLIDTPHGYLVTSDDFEAFRFAEEGAKRYKNALHELAK